MNTRAFIDYVSAAHITLRLFIGQRIADEGMGRPDLGKIVRYPRERLDLSR